MTEQKKQENSNAFWVKGEGMTRRCHNIEQVKQLILSGLSYQEIRRKACKYFTFKKFDEYYEIASEEIENPTDAKISKSTTEPSLEQRANEVNKFRKEKEKK